MSEPIRLTEPLEPVAPVIPEAGVPVAKDSASATVSTTSASTGVVPQQAWASRHLQNMLLLAICGTIIYLAVEGEEQARQTLYSVFLILAGVKFGSQTALKVPGRDA